MDEATDTVEFADPRDSGPISNDLIIRPKVLLHYFFRLEVFNFGTATGRYVSAGGAQQGISKQPNNGHRTE